MKRVPRYTSYPTAPHFHEGVDSCSYSAWLGSLSDNDSLSLYFHIPYCKQLCWFCGCHTKIVNKYEPVSRYLELLEQEVGLVAKHVNNISTKHIHFGGGSPSILTAEDFLRFMNLLREKFTIESNAEVAIEIDPRTVDEEKIAAYAKTGVTRASLGVQDFDQKVQEAINRVQSYKLVSDVVREFRLNNINEINLDLIYGLPYQTTETIKRTIELSLELKPSRISLFGYAHVPWMKKHQKLVPEEALPNKDERIEMFEYATEDLLKEGYISIGLDHFVSPEDSMAQAARDKRLQRNFQGYTTDTADAVIGMGVSSISSLPRCYAQNTSDNIDYAKAIREGELPIVKGVELTDEDIKRRNIIMSLMCNLQVEIDAQEFQKEFELLQPYMQSGDVVYAGNMLIINPNIRSELRLVASVFDACLSDTKHRYSHAI